MLCKYLLTSSFLKEGIRARERGSEDENLEQNVIISH